MKQSILVVALLALAVPAHAQLGVLDKGLKKAQQRKDAKDKVDDLGTRRGAFAETTSHEGVALRKAPTRSRDAGVQF
jgi:hypothetical protein